MKTICLYFEIHQNIHLKRYRFFDIGTELTQLSDIDWSATPTAEEVHTQIDFADSADAFREGGMVDTFGVQATGPFTVETAGDYTFYLSADDGAALYIDGQLWVNNDYQHGFQTMSATVTLTAGQHDIEIRYFENYGTAGLRLEWDGPYTDVVELLQAA